MKLPKIAVITAFLSATILFTSKSEALPEEYDYIYYAALHESGTYNDVAFYSKNYGNKDWWSDSHLNKLAHARYNALDLPLINSVKSFINQYTEEEGFDINYMNVTTGGILTFDFQPSNTANVLDFSISGLTLDGIARIEDNTGIIEGLLRAKVTNVVTTGTYDYYNGIITVNDLNIDLTVTADVDLDIPVLGILVDPILDSFVDDYVEENLPTKFDIVLNASSGSIGGVKDFLPLNTLIHNGIDYGLEIRNKLETSSLINDNFSLSIGEVIVHKQYFSVTIGNVAYKRWTTGGKRLCIGMNCGL